MRKPPITINCDCGETKSVTYGERWVCDTCHRAWNTQQIPTEEYEGLLRRMRRHKLEALGMTAIVAAVLIPLIVLIDSSFIFLTPIVMAAWLFLVLPAWRRRYRRTARDAPRWELHPE
jgi:Flp pilus assembly protein TadB